jgi:hypothetical protein
MKSIAWTALVLMLQCVNTTASAAPHIVEVTTNLGLNFGEIPCCNGGDAGGFGNVHQASQIAPRTTGALVASGSGLNADVDSVFDWAETSYPEFFSPKGATQTTAGYRFRFYSGTSTYLAVNETPPSKLLALGPLTGGRVLDLGLLSEWTARAVKACVLPQVLQNNVCVDPTPQSCMQQALSWTVDGQTCGATAVPTVSGLVASLTDVEGTTGSAIFVCTNGVWGNPAAAICNAPALGCAAQTLTWNVGGQSCNANASEVVSGQSIVLSDMLGTTGVASFSCTNGAWSNPITAACSGAGTLTLASVPDGFFGGAATVYSMPFSTQASASASVSCIGNGCPTAYDISSFSLSASGSNYTIVGLAATNLTPGSPVVPLFSGLVEGQTIANGQKVVFKLQSPFTRGATVNLRFGFTIQETGATFNYSVQLRTN